MVALSPSGNTLLSAGLSIKLWDLETKESLMVIDKHFQSSKFIFPFEFTLLMECHKTETMKSNNIKK